MNQELALVLAILLAAVLMFAINRPRVDAVGLIMIVLLPFTGVITIQEALAGFSNPNIILIAAMFVIGEALARTGVARGMGDWLAIHGGDQYWRLLAMIMISVAILGAFMSNTAVVAIFVPIVLRIAARRNIDPRELMMPLAYAALISGTQTLVATTSNLVINYQLVRSGSEGFHFFAFAPFGIPILMIGIVYMLLTRSWLVRSPADQPKVVLRPSLRHWVEKYQLQDREFRVRVKSDSRLANRTLKDLALPSQFGIRALLIERGRGRARQLLPRRPELMLLAGDVLLLDVDRPEIDIDMLCEELGMENLPRSGRYFADKSQAVGMVEVFVPDESRLVGLTVAEAQKGNSGELTIVGMRSGPGTREPRHLRERVIKAGDTLLMAGPWGTIRALQKGGHDIVILQLPEEHDEYLPASSRAPHAVIVLVGMVIAMASGVIPMVHAALIGCLLMGFLRCITLEQAYRAISLRALIMVVGMMPFAIALERTGGIELAANGVLALAGDAGPRTLLAMLFLITVVTGLFIVATANAVLLIPVGLAVAAQLGASPYPFAMIIALACCLTFMTPISSVNTLVTTAGQYGFGDFVRIGLPLTLIIFAFAVLAVPWVLPVYP